MKTILIMVPHMPMIFEWVSADNIKIINFFNFLNKSDHKVILKFHPRYSEYNKFKDSINLDTFQLEHKENVLELMEISDLIIAFETSSVLFEAIFKAKPLIYIQDYIQLFNNDEVYKDFLSYISCYSFDNAMKILSNSNSVNFNDFLPRISYEDIFYSTGDKSAKATVKNIEWIINHDQRA